MYKDVVARLVSLGYAPTGAEKAAIQLAIDRAGWYLKGNLNQTTVPRGLRFVWIDMAAGMYLSDLKAAGKLTGFEFDAPTKSIKMGDVTVTLMSAGEGAISPEAQFDRLLLSMVNPPPEQLAAYRRVRW